MSVTIDQTTAPTHNHTFNASYTAATAAAISTAVLPGIPTASNAYAYVGPTIIQQTLAAGVCGITGGNQAHPNLMPSLCISFIIALVGIFPSRN